MGSIDSMYKTANRMVAGIKEPYTIADLRMK